LNDSVRVLVVDDERSMREFLEIFFRREGHEVVTVGDVDSALVAIENDDFDIVISDIQMPARSGLELLREARVLSPETVFVMITAYASTETAIEAMREGAYDYITKPFKVEEIRITVQKALEKKLLRTENQRLKTELRSQKRERSMIGNSTAIQRVFDLVDQVAETKTNVLICGESGTGKELVARAIHDRSQRCDAPFVAINCGAIPENLLESELFGHVKGAFTGAVQNKAGLFDAASRGTLFLDEIGELTPALQVKLLRALQEKRIRRVGGTRDEPVDVRILAATNQNLEEGVAAGRFREDLYYRLNVIQVTLPPLRERVDDIPLLVMHFVEKYTRELGREVTSVSDAALQRLADYAFPGNVRELENVIERAVALTRGETIGVDALPPNVLRPTPAAPVSRITREGVDLDGLMASYEKGLLSEALEKSGGVKKRAAALLGISFRSFRYRLEKLRLEDSDDEE
jgi:two-component system response regulator PilR (NtrC family)